MNIRLPHGFYRRVLYVVAAAAIAAGFIGFLTGTRRAPSAEGYGHARSAVSAGDAMPAPSQKEIAERRFGMNRTRHPAALAALAEDHPDLMEVVELSEEKRRAELDRRGQNRAYEGAPPTIPHPVEQRGYPSCTACHTEGLRVAGQVAGPMSHPPYRNCTQCHVVQARPMPSEPQGEVVPDGNTFVGLRSSAGGDRAWAGAPPVVPHSTFMRENCSGCHGVWATGIRTTHPWRQSCSQCHAPSAERDQRPVADRGPPPGVGATR